MVQHTATASQALKSRSNAPIRKVTASTIGGAVATLVLWALAEYAHFHPEPAIAAAITTVITFVVGYLTPPSQNDAPVAA